MEKERFVFDRGIRGGKSIVASVRFVDLVLVFHVSDAALYWHSRWMDTFVAAEVAMHDDGGDDRVLLV